jgi:hypothetical protein
MKFTVRALVEPLGNEAKLNLICRTFSSMVRTAYNQLLGKRADDVVNLLQTHYGIGNWRWRQWAIVQAQATIDAQRNLLPLYAEMYQEKIKCARRKMTRVADPLKKKGYLARINKLERRKARVEKHIDAETVPHVVFGSRNLFEKMPKDNILREEWRRRRSNQFFSVGQANQNGNANTRITRRDSYVLEVRNWPCEDFEAKLRVPVYYQSLLAAVLASGIAYTVRVKRTERNYQALVSFEVDEAAQLWNGRRIAAVDVNPKGLAVTIVSPDGNLFASRWFPEPALVHASAGKRSWLAANLVKRAFRWAKGYGCNAVVIERLKFGMAQESSHGRNRVCSNFLRKKLIQIIKLRALKLEWVCAEVNPAYSSVAGKAKYGRSFSRFNGHQLAALVLGRRALGYGEKLNTEQIKTIKHRAYAVKTISQSHRHLFLMPRLPADGRIGGEDAKGSGALMKRVTPHAAITVRLRLLGGGCPEDESGARGHRVNPPVKVKLGSVKS